ncbi:carbon monoxide dehydrogenase CooS [Clostridium saccharobutylicum DSM 13864]|nr:carbon monoxide dehydrogenase CooS [Clostridium saccharobutylicum DSM 13864]
MSMCTSADCKLCEFLSSKEEIETSFNRVDTQKAKCKFGKEGVCCKLCSNGPCKITPKSPRGICGADADTIVSRNFLRAIAAGSACYLHVVENTARNLKNIGEGKGNVKIKSPQTLNQLAEIFDITESDINQKAIKVADAVLADLYKPRFEKMELVKKLAYAPRYKRWEELNILPGGAKSEVFDAIVKTSTNLNSDPVDMLFNALGLGVATGIYGLMLTNLLNDVILGVPTIRQARVGFRVIDEDYINIMITGHQHSHISHLQDRLIDEDVKKKAINAGAKGFRLVGCTCVGQDLQLRGEHYTEVFSGHAGNNYTSEAVLATGGIDLIVSEFNCTIPGLEPIAEQFKVKTICIDDVAKKKNAKYINFDMDNAEEIRNK